MARVEVEKVSRWLDSQSDNCLLPDCVRCVYARELARMVRDGALAKNVPISSGKGTFVPKTLPLTPEFIAECKTEGLPDPVKELPGFISWCKEERIQKRDWLEFFKVMLRKKRDKLQQQNKYVPPPVYGPLPIKRTKMSPDEIERILNGKK